MQKLHPLTSPGALSRTKASFLALGLWIVGTISVSAVASAQGIEGASWRYFRPGNTGIQGDYNDAIFIDDDNDPWIGGYDPSFEEGGIAKFIQAENRWVNISNIDYPVIGHPNTTGTTRVSDIVKDADGRLWLSTLRGALRFDPAIGPSSLVNYASANAHLANGGCRDLDIAPDGTIWFALLGFGGETGGMLRYTPGTNQWKFWTGGAVPQGGNGWPQLVWSLRSVSVQPKPGGGYTVWCDSENTTALVSFDSGTQLWTFHEFSFTLDSILEMPGKDCVDDSGNFWATRFAGFVGSNATYHLDYRRSDGTWVSPPQPPLPAANPPIWAFRAYGNGQALLIDDGGHVRRFNGTTWQDYGVWREGAFSSDVNVDDFGNVWACGTGGAAKRDATTGVWQRYRVTNTSQYDLWNGDLSIDPSTGDVYACANAGSGIGGLVQFDGTRWTGYNIATYGLGHPWPFPTDNSEAVAFRPSTGNVSVNPMFNGIREWNGTSWTNLNGMTVSEGLVEDSIGRLWSLGEYYSLRYFDDGVWTNVPNNGAWGMNIQADPERSGTIWAATFAEIIRTDGSYRFSRDYTQFPELDTQSDLFTTVAAAPGGIAWFGSTQGMFRIDANTGDYDYYESLGGISCLGASPLAVTPDGKVWFVVWDISGVGPNGLAWFDGDNAGLFPAPIGGEPQWGGLPHAQIYALQTRVLPTSYELWMSCASRGLAVLTIPTLDPADAPDVAQDPRIVWSTSFPNPFAEQTAIRFDLPSPGPVEVGIFDVAGRTVRSLANRTMDAGVHELTWDGRDAHGRTVGSGVYFYRIDVAGETTNRRITRVR